MRLPSGLNAALHNRTLMACERLANRLSGLRVPDPAVTTRLPSGLNGDGARSGNALTHPFAFVVSFHIVFPAFTIGLAAWLATLEGTRLRDRQPGLSAGVRLLAQSVRALVWDGRGHRYRHGVSVRHPLERAGRAHRTYPGAAARLRGVHRVLARGDILRRDAAWPRPRAAVVLFLLVLHGFLWNHAVVVLDPLQQQLDASAAGPRHRGRQIRPGQRPLRADIFPTGIGGECPHPPQSRPRGRSKFEFPACARNSNQRYRPEPSHQ